MTSSLLGDPTPEVFVVDDDVSVRESLEGLLACSTWRVSTFASAEDFLAHRRALVPSCLILDVGLPGMSGLDVQSAMASEGMSMPIIFITGYRDVRVTVRAMKAGAIEFLTKPFTDAALLEAIGNALAWSRAKLTDELATRALRSRYDALTKREREVLGLVVCGRLNKQIAGELGISDITVKVHRGKMMRKMAARSLPDLVHMAAKLVIAPAPERKS
jgi:FixJ family two-component response regulator